MERQELRSEQVSRDKHDYTIMYNLLFSRAGLSLERLRTFVEVADAGSMAKAANGDTVRQSLFSRQIKELEEHFGRKFTEKNGRAVVLTKEGEEFAFAARQILGALEDFHRGAAARSELQLGAGESFCIGVVLPRIEQIRERLGGVTLAMRNMRGSEIVAELQSGKLDMGVIDETEVAPGLNCEELGRLSYRLVAPENREESHDWRTVLRLPFVGMEGPSRVGTVCESLANKARVELVYAVKCSSWLGVSSALAGSGYAGVLPGVLKVPTGHREIACPGLKGLDRKLILGWDARRGNIGTRSDVWQRALSELLRF